MNPDVSDATVIEVYSKQFDWTARYSGADNILGDANFRLVEGRIPWVLILMMKKLLMI